MKCSILRTAAALLAVAVLFCVPASAAPTVSAKSAVVLDCESGRILFEKNADEQSLIASTTKIMTALVVIEECDLDAKVKIMPDAVGIEGSSMYLKRDEILTVRDLLYGLMLRSGNDAAVALAIYCGGSVEGFVEQMNRKAHTLGLESSHFSNPNGLDDPGNYSTARDLAKLTAYAMDNETFHEIVSTKSMTAGGRAMTNHNKLLWNVEGAVGVKTGYTRAAGRILVGAVERDGRRLVSVTINAPNDWSDHAAMLSHGFESFCLQQIVEAGESLAPVPLLGGEYPVVYAAAAVPFSYSMLPEETVQIRLHLPRMVFAPVEAGSSAGCAEILLDGRQIGSVPLIWKFSDEQSDFMDA